MRPPRTTVPASSCSTTVLAIVLSIGLLAGCGRLFEKDDEGKTHVREGSVEQLRETGRELRQAGRELRRAGRELRQAGREVAEAGKRAGRAVEPVAKELLGDAGLTARVKARLIADPEVRGSSIDVDTVDGKVTLTGTVESREIRDEAVKLARRTEGVVKVVDRLKVEPRR